MANKARKAAAQAAAQATPTTNAAGPAVAPTAPPAAVPAALNPLLAQQLQNGKAYNVRPNTASDNAATWALLQGALTAAGGKLTRAELQAVAQQRNHVNFVGYAIRRGWLVPAPAAS